MIFQDAYKSNHMTYIKQNIAEKTNKNKQHISWWFLNAFFF